MEGRQMRCPFCKHVFIITRKQMDNNLRFKCPSCKGLNQGSAKADEYGVLIGLTKSDLYALKEA